MNQICHYCGHNPASEESAHLHTMYYIAEKKLFPLGYKYSTKEISVPRCPRCAEAHRSFGFRWSLGLLVVSFASLVYFYSDQADSFIGLLIGSGIGSFIVAGLAYWLIKNVLFERLYNVKREENIDEFQLVQQMRDFGWLTFRPDPSNQYEVEQAIERRHNTIAENNPHPEGETRTTQCDNCYSFNYKSDSKCHNCGKTLAATNA